MSSIGGLWIRPALPSSIDVLRLSLLDRAIPACYVGLALHFAEPQDESALQSGLAATLSGDYRAFAGQMSSDGAAILLSDRGALWTSSPDDWDSCLLRVAMPTPHDLQVSFDHRVTDAEGFVQFLLAWSRATKTGPSCSSAPIRPRLQRLEQELAQSAEPAVAPSGQIALPAFILAQIQSQRPVGRAAPSRQVLFSRERLQAMKASVMARVVAPQWVSTTDVLTAHLWQIFAGKSSRLCVAINLRSLLDKEDASSWGNCALCIGVQRDFGGDDVCEAALHIRREIQAFDKTALLAALRWCQDALNQNCAILPNWSPASADSSQLLISSWEKFPWYQFDAGRGTPAAVQPLTTDMPERLLILLPAHSGIVVHFSADDALFQTVNNLASQS